ncbi:MAG TPA: sulfatase-like hydrolase/transferase [Chitinophagaceae bacterium]|nr:sulfatase-like hydrolase/transferase [Chitinophagaceae bacterium]
MKRLLKTTPFFLVLLPVFFFLHLLTDYFRVLYVHDLYIPETFWYLFIPFVLFLIFMNKRPIMHRLALLVFVLLVFFFFFGPIHLFLEKVIPPVSKYTIMLPVLGIIVIAVAIFVIRKRRPFYGVYRYLNVLMLVLLGYEIILFSLLLITDGSIRRVTKQYPISDNFKKCDTCINPDIYYLVFDMYVNSEVLQSFWKYDNSKVEDFLDSSGFYYARHSKSNYNFTVFSIGSTLNMEYHDKRIKYTNAFRSSRQMIQAEDNELFRILKKQGYGLYNYSWFYFKDAPSRVTPFALSDPRELVASQTFWFRFKKDIAWHFKIFRRNEIAQPPFFLKECQDNLARIPETYNGIKKLSASTQPQPVFAYAHFLMPHAPFLFDSTGKVKPQNEWGLNTHQNYLDQLKYANKMIMDLCTTLQKEAKRPRIIIVQSDHGYRNYTKRDNLPHDVELKNLSAFYFPGQRYDKLYDSISNVNTFRVIMDKYFNYHLPLLKDTSFYMLLR